jgi:hypothetical protein
MSRIDWCFWHDPLCRLQGSSRARTNTFQWSFCRATSRYGVWRPNPRDLTIVNGSDGVNNWSKSNEAIKGAVFDSTLNWNITDMVSRLFTTDYLKSWAHFASTKYKPGSNDPPASWLSLETIHNLVHVCAKLLKVKEV